MKKQILLVVMVVASINLYAQINPLPQVVTDPGTHSHFVTQIGESVKQTTKLEQSLEFLKKQRERIEKISTSVSQLNYIERLITNNRTIVRLISNNVDMLRNSNQFTMQELNDIERTFTRIVNQTLENLDFAKKITQEGFFTMDDAERIKLLREAFTKSDEQLQMSQVHMEYYKSSMELRKIKNTLNAN